jgi:glycosyltransferase involved in cell wall biosynthesis
VKPSRGPSRLIAYARARRHGTPSGFARGASGELTRTASTLAAQDGRGRIVADGPIVAAALSPLMEKHPVIYNAHNIESTFRADLDPPALMERPDSLQEFERRVLKRACESWMASRDDLNVARGLAPDALLRLVPNAVDVAAIKPVPAHPRSRRALFVADYSYLPNLQAVAFLTDEVWPRVLLELPDATLALVGRDLPERFASEPGVEALGFVADLAVAYASANCAAVPLLSGGGSPLKLIEALAYGVPVVATPRAAATLGLQDGIEYMAGEGADAFARGIVELMRGGAGHLASRGRAFIEANNSIEAVARSITA